MYNRTSTFRRALCNSALWLIGFALLLATAQIAGAQTTYAIGTGRYGQVCGMVNLATGQWTLLNGETGSTLVGIGQFGANLYGGAQNSLYEVNTANCAYVFVGNGSENFSYYLFGSTTGAMAALYGINADDLDLYSVHASNGATMLVGPINLTFTYGGSLSANCPVLYATVQPSGGDSILYSVNTNTGAATQIGDTGIGAITAMVCGNDQLFAMLYDGDIYILNLTNGLATYQSHTEPYIVGMAYPPGPPPTYTVLHSFTGGADGNQPWSAMTLDAAGNLYGTTAAGGTGSCSYLGSTGCGTIFQLKKHNSAYIFNPLYSFQGGSDGEFPARPLTRGPNGTYYGTTTSGGEGTCFFDNASECGVVFNAGPTAQPPRSALLEFRESVLYRFTGGADGANPFSTVVFDGAGNLYATTLAGGANGLGAVVELSPAGGGTYTESVLYSFAGGNDGQTPYDGVIFDNVGNLYGTTAYGGGSTDCQSGCGTVFELSPAGSGWTEKVLYRFQGTGDGQYPPAGVAIDTAGNLYGNTNQAATGQGGGGGTVYELSPNGSNWTFTVLRQTGDSGFGYGRVVLDSSGNLYEALQGGGAFGYGQVFELAHGTLIYTDLYDFTSGADGSSPFGGVTVDSSGNVYGTTLIGGSTNCGTRGCGVVWEISPSN